MCDYCCKNNAEPCPNYGMPSCGRKEQEDDLTYWLYADMEEIIDMA